MDNLINCLNMQFPSTHPYLCRVLDYKGSSMVAIMSYILLKLDNKAEVIPKSRKPHSLSRNKA